jgi:hypothetical protein
MIMKKENPRNLLMDLSSNMTKVIDTNKYIEFVRQTTSPASSDFAAEEYLAKPRLTPPFFLL